MLTPNKEIYLQINPSGYKMMRMRDQNKMLAQLKPKVLARDHNTCQFCAYTGIPAQMLVVNLDGNYNNNDINNLICSCSICSRCVLLGSFEAEGDQNSVERLIICNELSQTQLNHLYRVLLVSMSDPNLEHYEVAKSIFRSLRSRANLVDDLFGANTSDTRVFVQLVLDSGISQHANLRPILNNLRYFPTRHSFKKEWPLWREQLKHLISKDINIKL